MGLRAFLGQLGADALLFFQAGDFVAAGAAVDCAPGRGPCSSGRDRPVVGVRVGDVVVLAGHQVAGDVAGFVLGQAQAGHRSHLLHLQLVAVVGALGRVPGRRRTAGCAARNRPR